MIPYEVSITDVNPLYNMYSNIFDKNKQRGNDEKNHLQVQKTRWIFFALCCYLISQCYTIPIFAIGPSWALWPCLSDVAIVLLILTFLMNFRQTVPLPKPAKPIFSLLLLVIYGSTLSYFLYLDRASDDAPGIVWGIYQLFRLIQFISVFLITAKIPLTPNRIVILNRLIGAAFLFVCLGVFLTYSAIIPLSAVTAHLPEEGPWPEYAAWANSGGGRGLGFVGYNYAYTAVQITLLLVLKLCLSDFQKQEFHNSILVFISAISCLLSSSRSGFSGMFLFAVIYWLNRPKSCSKSFISLALVLIAISFISIELLDFNHLGLGFSSNSQDSAFDRFTSSDPDKLSGRDEIWKERIEFLNEDFIRWFLGTGFGSTLDSGNFAHMLPLQIILETGFIGLSIFTLLFYKILRYFYLIEIGVKPIFLGTVALLFTSIGQETFYPVPALIHFLGFYLCTLAISFQKYSGQNHEDINKCFD
jgi:heme/copper-type cytochrome/quinol oxidase subunit 4